jgi:hypothetical protein
MPVKNFDTKEADSNLEIFHLLNDVLHCTFQATSLHSFPIGLTCSLHFQSICNQHRPGSIWIAGTKQHSTSLPLFFRFVYRNTRTNDNSIQKNVYIHSFDLQMKYCLHSMNILKCQQKTKVFGKQLPSLLSPIITTNRFKRKYSNVMCTNW